MRSGDTPRYWPRAHFGALLTLIACTAPATSPELISVTIAGGDRTLVEGGSIGLSAQVAVAHGADTTVVWTTSAPAVASVEQTGLVEALAPGTTSVRATSLFDPNKYASVTVTVVGRPREPEAAPVIEEFAAHPGDIVLGESSELSWAVSGKAAEISVREVGGSVLASGLASTGTLSVSPKLTTDYLLAVRWAGGADIDAPVRVVVLPPRSGPPIARVSTTPTLVGFAPLVVGFDGSTSADPGGGVLSYAWDFGDGSTATGARTQHAFATEGVFEVTLIVRNEMGEMSSPTKTRVVVGRFGPGELIGQSADGGNLSPSRHHRVAVDGNTGLASVTEFPYGQWWESFLVLYGPRSQGGGWEEVVRLPGYGGVVALSGDTLAVMASAPAPGSDGGQEAVVRVLERGPFGAWEVRATLLEGLGVTTYLTPIALGDGVLVVGDASYDPRLGGRALVYTRGPGAGDGWALAQEIRNPTSESGTYDDYFGSDVAVSSDGERIAVVRSVQSDDDHLGPGTAVFIYERRQSENLWDLSAQIAWPALPADNSAYVAIDGETLAVTARPLSLSAETRVAVYERDSDGENRWGKVAQHTLMIQGFDYSSLDWEAVGGASSNRLAGDTLAVGIVAWIRCQRPELDCPGPTPAGAIHLFGRDVGGPAGWGEAQVLLAPGPGAEANFTMAFDLSSDGRGLIATTSSDPYPPYGTPQEADVYMFSR